MIEAIEEVNDTSEIETTLAAPHTSAAKSDGVVLSETAQVVLLQQDGLSLGEIADELGIPKANVMSDLFIASATTQTPASAVNEAIPGQASAQL
jgi:DNA-directed RNA polymerase specialized sigma24 family protein